MRLLIEARNGPVAVEGGCVVEPTGRFEIVLRFPDGDARPGLINAHDHLHRNHYGQLGRPPYPNAYAWARDIQRHDAAKIAAGRRLPRREALLRGAWKNLFAGVTTIVHHDPWESDFDSDFPIRVARLRTADSLGFDPGLQAAQGDGPLCIHAAEGIDEAATREIHELAARGLLNSNLLVVHGVGVDAAGAELMRAAGCGLIWCPTSNLFLFGKTAPAEIFASGVDILLGSDSLLTGAGNLLDELRYARALGLIDDERLLDAVGGLAASRLGLASPSLDIGAAADLVVVRRPPLDAEAQDVALVLVAGIPRLVDPEIAPALGAVASEGRRMKVGRVERWVVN